MNLKKVIWMSYYLHCYFLFSYIFIIFNFCAFKDDGYNSLLQYWFIWKVKMINVSKGTVKLDYSEVLETNGFTSLYP